MLGIGDKLPEFSITGVKPGFNEIVENGEDAFETVTEKSLRRKVENHLLLPKRLHFRLPNRDR